jgi:hypothetical protein
MCFYYPTTNREEPDVDIRIYKPCHTEEPVTYIFRIGSRGLWVVSPRSVVLTLRGDTTQTTPTWNIIAAKTFQGRSSAE